MSMEDTGEVVQQSTPAPVEEGAPLWTVTFGDMMSLLLTFFILLFSMSELKMDRFLLASQSLREAMGGTAEETIEDPMGLMPDPVDPDLEMQNPGKMDGAGEAPGAEAATTGEGTGAPDWANRLAEAYLDAIAAQLKEYIEENGLEDTLEVERLADGVYLRIQATALFGSGDAVIRNDSEWLLNTLAEITREIDVRVVISGHADNVPISTARYASNWELSAARAAGVAHALVQQGQNPELLRVESWGEYRPVDSNGSAEGRARNRRVELYYARADIIAAARATLATVEADEGDGGQEPGAVGAAPAGG
ncbi:MAG: OmpA family protein [Longimicrobiales bacterium]